MCWNLILFAKDHLNSVHALLDRDGNPVQRYHYSAYGKTRVEKTTPQAVLVKNPFAYTSREWEEETGDYFYRARYYDPSTGRFLTLDPIGFRGGDTNLYRYVKNNPLMYRDPFGLLEWSDVEDAWENGKDAFEDALEKGDKAVDENLDRIKKYWADQWKNAEDELDKHDPNKSDNNSYMCPMR